MKAQSVITVGNFDGVHVGHAELVRRARALASSLREGSRVVAMTFDPHPITRLRPEHAPRMIMGFARRAELLRGLGADEVVRVEPTADVLNRTAEQFVRSVVEAYRPAAFVEGSDFRFGRGREGTVAVLAELGARLGFAVEVVKPVGVALEDQTLVTASSSLARWLVRHGRARDAAAVLGRPHELRGRVVQGDRRGRTIGFPTANLSTEDLRPADGVYAAVARLEDGRSWAAAVNVGSRPTFAGMENRVEAHLLIGEPGGWAPGADASGWRPIAGLAEYGWPLTLELVGWVRDQVKFDSPRRLVEQISRDRARVAEMVMNLGAGSPDGGAARPAEVGA
ncbi:MAG: adenylyltransferase/cytidyltransferase family protein [Phycisphaerales bacterium]|nr:adenylyltransferase/cytidyltransferase family protein [Phycisphaerales bacterium]